MDEFLALVGVQAMRYAIRSSIAVASTYAIGRLSHLVKSADDHKVCVELKLLHDHLVAKIKIISPAIDLIELKSSRGNVFLDSAAPMTKALQQDIASVTTRLEHTLRSADASPIHVPEHTRQAAMQDVEIISQELRELLGRIDREIPLLQLAITASGETLTTSLPESISPSRLLQASTLLVVGDIQFSREPTQTVQIGPTFYLSLYMLFQGHAPHPPSNEDPKSLRHSDGKHGQQTSYGLGLGYRKPLWQEVVHKARVCLLRTARPGDAQGNVSDLKSYSYQLEIVEDLDDGRNHDEREDNGRHGYKSHTMRRDFLPVPEVSKLFYTDTGKILNISHDDAQEHNPILLLKRDTGSQLSDGDCKDTTGTRVDAGSTNTDEQADIDKQLFEELNNLRDPRKALPHSALGLLNSAPHLDPEWIAFEVFEANEEAFDDSPGSVSAESEGVKDTGSNSDSSSCQQLTAEVEELNIHTRVKEAPNVETPPGSPLGAITSSLSLLEILIRLASLQEFQQTSHLAIPDHILTFFLEETSSTGLVGDSHWKARKEAKAKVGFDPYTDQES